MGKSGLLQSVQELILFGVVLIMDNESMVVQGGSLSLTFSIDSTQNFHSPQAFVKYGRNKRVYFNLDIYKADKR